MTEKGIEFSSDITVKLVRTWGTDKDIPETARVSSAGWDEDVDLNIECDDGDISLIELLATNHHTSPFEHVGATFFLHVPIFVMREWMRHRTQSYNEESGRWRVLEGRFYVPDNDRPVAQVGRTGEYRFEPDPILNRVAQTCIKRGNTEAWDEYQFMLGEGIAKEVARMVLPVNIYTRVIVTANYLNWIRFLNLRTTPQAMHEIRHAAFQVEEYLTEAFPIATQAWKKDV